MTDSNSSAPDDQWLTSMFAAAAGPVVDSAFAERILSRLRRRERMRLYVILGTVVIAAILTGWLADGIIPAIPTLDTTFSKLPNWLPTSSSVLAACGALLAGLTVWMVAEEA